MTCIVAIGNGENVWMGGDGVRHNDNDQTSRLTEPKIFIRDYGHDKILIGASGSHLMQQLLQREWGPPPEMFDDRLARDVMWEVRKDLWEFLHQEKHRSVICDQTTNQIQGVIIVGFRGQVWSIDSDGALCEYKVNYHAVGAGDEYALGSLHTSDDFAFLRNERGGEMRRIESALKAASFHLSSIQGPYTYLEC